MTETLEEPAAGALQCDDFPGTLTRLLARGEDPRWQSAPILLCGMVGSKHGWRETPYAATPAGVAELAQGLVEARSAEYYQN